MILSVEKNVIGSLFWTLTFRSEDEIKRKLWEDNWALYMYGQNAGFLFYYMYEQNLKWIFHAILRISFVWRVTGWKNVNFLSSHKPRNFLITFFYAKWARDVRERLAAGNCPNICQIILEIMGIFQGLVRAFYSLELILDRKRNTES